jgi:hypothetical protein
MQRRNSRTHFYRPVRKYLKILPFAIFVIGHKHVVGEGAPKGKIVKIGFL